MMTRIVEKAALHGKIEPDLEAQSNATAVMSRLSDANVGWSNEEEDVSDVITRVQRVLAS